MGTATPNMMTVTNFNQQTNLLDDVEKLATINFLTHQKSATSIATPSSTTNKKIP